MDAAERAISVPLAGALLLGCAALGCASDGGRDFDTTRPTQAKAEIEQTKKAAESEPAPATPEPRPEPAEPELDPAQPVVTKPGVVHFETARVDEDDEPPQPSLFEAAAAERKRRESSAPAQIVITDANLSDFSEVGQLSEFTSEDAGEEEGGDAPGASEDEVDPETLWRTRARNARLAWRAAADRISELEARVAELRYEFYSEDDPHHRDAVTKPAWDRAAIDLEQARIRVEEVRLQLDQVLEEGLAAGALPGWLREGMEFEPTAEADAAEDDSAELETAMPIEPPIAEEPPR